MVFDNVVVYYCNVIRNMGVSIDFRRFIMCCLMGMCDICIVCDLCCFNCIC